MIEFAGKDFIYLSKLKKEKIKKIRKAEEDNKGEAPIPAPPKINNKQSKVSDFSDDSLPPQISHLYYQML